MPLLTASQLTALQKVAERGMTDLVEVSRPTRSDSVYGDDEAVVYTDIAQVKAWFRSTPTPVATADVGALITSNTYRLLVPVGSDIQPKDQVTMSSGEVFLVTDTTYESTWKPYLQISLRRRE